MTLKRTTPLQRSGGPSRKSRITPKKRSASERERIYGGEYGSWLSTQPCIIQGLAGHTCWGAIERCHTENGGMGRKANAETQVPACHGAHQLQHTIGVKSFERVFSVNLKALALEHVARFAAYTESGR